MNQTKKFPKNPSSNIEMKKPTALRDLGANYKCAFVTFIDILGFKDKIKNENAAKINSTLDKMAFFSTQPQMRRRPYSYKKNLPIIFQFSDSIIRIQPVDIGNCEVNIIDLFWGEITSLIITQGNLVCNGILVRGGLTYGDICVHQNRIFGPAFNRAYEIESKYAIYPRIIVDECLVEDKDYNPIIKVCGQWHWNQVAFELYDYLFRSYDGEWMLNYLPHLYEAKKEKHLIGLDVLMAHRDQLKALLEKSKTNKNEKELSKARWIATYHNDIIKRCYPKHLEECDNINDTLLLDLL